MNAGAVLVLCLSVAACASAQSGSAVPNSERAIQIAGDRCHWTPAPGHFEKWYAVLHQGVWHVWLTLQPGAQTEPTQGRDPDYDFLDLRIRASDGSDSGCVMAVG